MYRLKDYDDDVVLKPILWIIPADVVVAGNFVVTCVIPAKCIVLVNHNFGFVLVNHNFGFVFVFLSIIYVSTKNMCNPLHMFCIYKCVLPILFSCVISGKCFPYT